MNPVLLKNNGDYGIFVKASKKQIVILALYLTTYSTNPNSPAFIKLLRSLWLLLGGRVVI